MLAIAVFTIISATNVKAQVVVEPLLETKWSQHEPYNNLCPMDGSNRSVTGCVATAMAQIMKYWEYPAQRTVSIPAYTTQTRKISIPAITGTTTYNWNDMKNITSEYTTDPQCTAVATLMYHCGAAIKMDYKSSSSGASGLDAIKAIATYFDYDMRIKLMDRRDYDDSAWHALLRTELDAGRPVYYSGQGSGGHAFVCDGYRSDNYFHFNWGWGDIADGWFLTSALNPGSYNYTADQDIIINIMPKEDMSQVFCGGDGTVNNPYLICTEEQLKYLADYANGKANTGTVNATDGKYFKLKNNLDLTRFPNWEAIGTNGYFKGIFNGGGKVIRNLTINRPMNDITGLFGGIYGKIENLGLENCNIIGQNFVAGLVAMTNDSSIISNCYVTGNIRGEFNVGGLVASNGKSIISNCYVRGNVSGNANVGGLVGENYYSTIKNCIAANDSVTATYGKINRIAGTSSPGQSNGIYQNNYALNTMVVKNNSGNVSITDGLNTIEGMSRDLDTLKTRAFYSTEDNWNGGAWNIVSSTSIWDIRENETLPFFRLLNNDIHEKIITDNFVIYPNPAQHTLYIESAEVVEQISIYDISGRMLQEANNPSTSIDISNLANGIYLVKVKTAQRESTIKIVKQ